MALEWARAKPEPLARGGAKAKPKLRAAAKTRAARKAKAAERGLPPAPSAVQLDPLLEAAYQLYLQGRSHNQSRVSRNAWLRNNLRNNSEVRTQLRQRMEAAQGAHRSESSAPSLPSGTGESASATPRRQPPPPPKAEGPARAQTGGPANHCRGNGLPAAQHVSQAPVVPEAWEPDEMEARRPPPPLSEWEWPSTPRGPMPSPLFPWVAWRQQPWRWTQSQFWLRVAS